MIQIITNTYKDQEHPYENGFIHTRVLEYIRNGHQTEVFVLNSKRKPCEYVFEGVRVTVGNAKDLYKVLNKNNDSIICVHFLTKSIAKVLSEITTPRKVVLFVHGVEALKWYERIFPGGFSDIHRCVSFLKYMVSNSLTLPIIRKFLSKTNHSLSFITVSKWMKDKAEKNWNCKGKYKWEIIPNIINSEIFVYQDKSEDDVKKMLSIRPFTTGKYANDITVKCVQNLLDEYKRNDLSITIVGKGPLYNKIVQPLISKKNVYLENRFLNTMEIVDYHKKNGLFICPTRQDAQGVSMCEAMSSGLVPITLYNTAIPEFLPNDKRLICRNIKDMENLVLYLNNNPLEFIELSHICSDFIRSKCSYETTVRKEIELFSQIGEK